MHGRKLSALIGLAVIVGLVGSGWHAAAAAEGEAIKVDLRTFKFKVRDEIASLFGYDDGESRLFFYAGGAGETTLKLPADGEYEVVIRASCDPALNERAKFKLTLDGEAVGTETLLMDDDPKDYKFTAKAKAGERKLAIEFTNDAYKENEYDRNLFVQAVTVRRK